MKYGGILVLVLAVILVAGCAGIVPGKQAGLSGAQPKGGGNTGSTGWGDHAVWTNSAGGKTYYVSPSGSNINDGSASAPWATPGYGSRQLAPGDTLVIRGGRYSLSVFDNDIIMPQSGKPDAWITIKGEEGNRPVLAGKDNLLMAIDIHGCSYVRIENLEITSDNGAQFRVGIAAAGKPVSHIQLENLYIHHIDNEGIDLADADDVVIRNCTFSYCGFGGIGGPKGEEGGIRNLLVTDCTLSYSGHYYQGGNGDNRPYDRPDGFGIEASAGPVEIRNTISEHNRGDGLDSKAEKTYIHDCIVANNDCDGIKLWGSGTRVENTLVYGVGDGKDSGWTNLVIHGAAGSTYELENVALHDNPTRHAYSMYAQYDDPAPISVVMHNCILSGAQGAAYFGPAVTLTADHNIFNRGNNEDIQVELKGKQYTSAQIEAGEIGSGNLCKDPRFVRPAWGSNGDYHLQQGSPGIDSGTATGAPSTDLDGKKRPVGSGYDIGPYEYGG